MTISEINDYQIHINGTDFEFNYLNLSFPDHLFHTLEKYLIPIEDDLNQINFLGFSKTDDVLVFRTNTNFIIKNIKELIQLDGYRFGVCDLNYKNGLSIRFYKEFWYLEGKAELRQIYEFVVYGRNWMRKVSSLL